MRLVSGDARDPSVAALAADTAEARGALTGWVNNAAVFRDASLTSAPAAEVLELITTNLALALTGCHAAVNHFVAHGRGGAVVNVSSHQAQRAVRGALPYATAKAAVEGLTRAMAVDHGPVGIRTNAVALGSISTERYESHRAAHPEVDAQMAALHPLGRVGTTRRSPTSWRSCCRRRRASSTAPSCPWTAAGPRTGPTPRPAEPARALSRCRTPWPRGRGAPRRRPAPRARRSARRRPPSWRR